MSNDISAASKKSDLIERIEKMNQEHRLLMEECVAQSGADPQLFIEKGIPQSELFMVELIPFIHKRYLAAPTNITKTVLDVGPQSFGGTRMLQAIHDPRSFCKLRLEVTAIDIVNNFEMLQKLIAPEVEFLVQDIFSVKERVWDFVICSHVIEHVPDPMPFLRQAQSLARDFVLVACPWEENPLTTRGHVNTIHPTFVEKAGGTDLNIYTNYMWGKQRQVCIFTLEGTAS